MERRLARQADRELLLAMRRHRNVRREYLHCRPFALGFEQGPPHFVHLDQRVVAALGVSREQHDVRIADLVLGQRSDENVPEGVEADPFVESEFPQVGAELRDDALAVTGLRRAGLRGAGGQVREEPLRAPRGAHVGHVVQEAGGNEVRVQRDGADGRGALEALPRPKPRIPHGLLVIGMLYGDALAATLLDDVDELEPGELVDPGPGVEGQDGAPPAVRRLLGPRDVALRVEDLLKVGFFEKALGGARGLGQILGQLAEAGVAPFHEHDAQPNAADLHPFDDQHLVDGVVRQVGAEVFNRMLNHGFAPIGDQLEIGIAEGCIRSTGAHQVRPLPKRREKTHFW